MLSAKILHLLRAPDSFVNLDVDVDFEDDTDDISSGVDD